MSFSASLIKKFRSDIDGDILSGHRPLVLVGLMGSGKSALGKRLSVALSLPFIDSDMLVEEEAGIFIAEIFELAGEAVSGKWNAGSECATEGKLCLIYRGAPLQFGTRASIKEIALSIWIDSTPEPLLSRIGNPGSRPLLTTGDPLEILTRLRKEPPLLIQRRIMHTHGQAISSKAMKKLLGTLSEAGHIERLLPSSPDELDFLEDV